MTSEFTLVKASEGNVLFNDAPSTFYLQLSGVGTKVVNALEYINSVFFFINANWNNRMD